MPQVQRLFESESIDSLLSRFKREVNRSGLKHEMKKREFFRTDGEKRRSKHLRHLKRIRKYQKWEDDLAIVPLKNCRKAIPPQGKLLLVEWILPGDNEPRNGFRFWDTVTYDLIMLGSSEVAADVYEPGPNSRHFCVRRASRSRMWCPLVRPFA